MKCDGLARRAIIFVTFIISTTILYGFTTRFLFTAPNYYDVSIDPEGGSYYDYGSKVAAAVWKGAGQWIGMIASDSTNVTVISATASEDAIDKLQDSHGLELNTTVSDGLGLESTLAAIEYDIGALLKQKRHRSPIQALCGPKFLDAGTASPRFLATMTRHITPRLQHSIYMQPVTTTEPLIPLWRKLCHVVKHRLASAFGKSSQSDTKRPRQHHFNHIPLHIKGQDRSIQQSNMLAIESKLYLPPPNQLSQAPHHKPDPASSAKTPSNLRTTSFSSNLYILQSFLHPQPEKKSCVGVVAITSRVFRPRVLVTVELE
ncbi:hypothetical protein M436DRAFT_66663 [Aureobasidium namibiae CBS 147.97]|uniref:Uncharacterized protein n=1 Tax=Aureobasidium namibiae CBS 147.97 TaxID=1043004 RepID=A0A074WKC6_9PEZI